MSIHIVNHHLRRHGFFENDIEIDAENIDKLFTIKKSIKNLSAAKGEIYESAEIEEIQIINSITRET